MGLSSPFGLELLELLCDLVQDRRIVPWVCLGRRNIIGGRRKRKDRAVNRKYYAEEAENKIEKRRT